MEFLAIIAIIVSVFLFAKLERIEARVKQLEQQKDAVPVSPSTVSAASQSIPQAVPTHATPAMSTKQVPSEPSWGSRFAAWVKEDWLLKLGALLLLIGFGWLVTYAFLNNWIGPVGRIALGLLAGTGILILGWWRMIRFAHQGSIFLVLGSTVILLTVFAAREIYDFFTPASALVIMFLSTVFVAVASVRYRTVALALTSLVLVGIVPLLTASPDTNYVALFAYLFVVTLGALWVTVVTGWRELTTAALLLISVYSAPHWFDFARVDPSSLLLFAYGFAALFFIANTSGIVWQRGREMTADLVAAGGTGFFLLAWIIGAAPTEWQSLLMVAWMLVFMVGAFMTFTVTRRPEPLYVYAGVGVTMLAAATAIELDGAALTIAYTVEVGLFVFLSYFLLGKIELTKQLSWLFLGPALLSLASIDSSAWRHAVLHADFFVLFMLAATLTLAGVYFWREEDTTSIENKEPILGPALVVIGSLYWYGLLWLSLHSGLQDDIATFIALVVYTVIGLATYFIGSSRNNKTLTTYGGVLLGFVVLRLLVIEVWRMELTGRIITFFVVGTLLMSTAFWGRFKKVIS